jgi:hypothetical protein
MEGEGPRNAANPSKGSGKALAWIKKRAFSLFH